MIILNQTSQLADLNHIINKTKQNKTDREKMSMLFPG